MGKETDQWARGIVEQAFGVVFPGVAPTLGALQLIQANGHLEGYYGLASKPATWKGSNNWGAVRAKATATDGQCPEGSFPANDQNPEGTVPVCFKKYETPLDGCVDMLRIMTRTNDEKKALLAGDLEGLCAAMREARYYIDFNLMKKHGAEEGKRINIQQRIDGMRERVRLISKSLGEPDGTASPGAAIPESAGPGIFLVMLISGILFAIKRRGVK